MWIRYLAIAFSMISLSACVKSHCPERDAHGPVLDSFEVGIGDRPVIQARDSRSHTRFSGALERRKQDIPTLTPIEGESNSGVLMSELRLFPLKFWHEFNHQFLIALWVALEDRDLAPSHVVVNIEGQSLYGRVAVGRVGSYFDWALEPEADREYFTLNRELFEDCFVRAWEAYQASFRFPVSGNTVYELQKEPAENWRRYGLLFPEGKEFYLIQAEEAPMCHPTYFSAGEHLSLIAFAPVWMFYAVLCKFWGPCWDIL